MKNIDYFFVNTILTTTMICFVIFPTRSNPVNDEFDIRSDDNLGNSNEHVVRNSENNLRCMTQEYQLNDVIILENHNLILATNNFTVLASMYRKTESKIFICLKTLSCSKKFLHMPMEYRILPNNSALIGKDLVLEDEYELNGDYLLTCMPHYEDEDNSSESSVPRVSTMIGQDNSLPTSIPHYEDKDNSSESSVRRVSTIIGQIGCVISIIALIAHLLMFKYLPSLRNLAGFNIASLSVSLILAYFFIFFGHMPGVHHVFCVISAILQEYFILVAYFWMNLMCFNIWKTLKQATDFLIFLPSRERPKHFICYSVYSWVIPLVITIVSVIGDNVEIFHPGFKPDYGNNNICRIGNSFGKAIFFSLPAFALFMINCSLLLISACMMTSHAMKGTKDTLKIVVKINYFLYVRLAIMLGAIWLLGIIALITENEILWFLYDIISSLQGLFLLIIFIYTKKIIKQISETKNAKNTSLSKPPISKRNSNVYTDPKTESQL